MARVAARSIRHFWLFATVLIALIVAGTAWAQEREARLPSGPMTEPSIAVSCPSSQMGTCKNNAAAACGNLCRPPDGRPPNGAVCAKCQNDLINICMNQCQ